MAGRSIRNGAPRGHSVAATNREHEEARREHQGESTSGSTLAPAAKVAKFSRGPTEHALNVGKYAAERVKGREATIRRAFVGSDRVDHRPPLARILSGGQGGEVRLKLYLSMLFIAVAHPYATSFPTRAWAELFGLPAPESDGARRVRDAIRWLEKNKLVRVVRRPGKEAEVFLLSEDGSGKPFKIVSKDTNIWIKLPPEMWAKGWMATLSGRALAILLGLVDYSSSLGIRSGSPFWVPPNRAKEVYSLSPETWTRGAAELEGHELLTSRMAYFKESPLGALRRRKEYSLNLARLKAPPLMAPHS